MAAALAVGAVAGARADVVTYEFRTAAAPSVTLGHITIDDSAVSATSPWRLAVTHAIGDPAITGFRFDLTSIGGPVASEQTIAVGSVGFLASDGPGLTGPDGFSGIATYFVLGEAWFGMRPETGGDLFTWTDYSNGNITVGAAGDWVAAAPAPGAAAALGAAGAVLGFRRRRT